MSGDAGPAVEQVMEHYKDLRFVAVPAGVPLIEIAWALHENARRILLHDGRHDTLAWLLRDGTPVGQRELTVEDQRDKLLLMEVLAGEVLRLGANELVMTCEAWEAIAVDHADPRAALRATDREDRGEALLTHLLRRGEPCRTLHSGITRTPHGIRLADIELLETAVAPAFGSVVDVWAEWETSS